MAKRINDKITQAYIEKYLEFNYEVNYNELPADTKVRTYFYDELPNTDVEGFPISSEYVLDGKVYGMQDITEFTPEERSRLRLRYYYMPCYHELYVGTTGSGKTTGCVEPQLRAISAQRNKPNLFFTDPKGELFDRNAQHLKEQGYRLFILNFKDIAHSDHWNPLDELYLLKQDAVHILDKIKSYAPDDIPQGLRFECAPSAIKATAFVYNGAVFASYEDAKNRAMFDKDVLELNIDSILVQLVNMFITVKNMRDPTWEFGAQDALRGILYAMLEDSVHDPDFTRDMMTIKTMHDYYTSIRNAILTKDPINLRNHPLVKGKPANVASYLSSMFDNAPNTMRSYCGVFDNSMKEWLSGHILSLTAGNTVDLLAEDDSPFAIFVVTRDYEKSDFQVAGMFIDWVYRTMLQAFEDGRTTHATHFMLDEFGNIPEIRHFENKIATARSRNLWFHLVVQSYMQIDAVYGKEQSAIIRDNCNMQVFLGSQNAETKEIFSKECGNHYIPALGSVYDSHLHEIVPARLVPVSEIEQIKPGDAIIKRYGCPIIHARFIRSYVCAHMGTYSHFFDSHALRTLVPTRLVSIYDARYTYPKTQKVEVNVNTNNSVRFRF